MSSKIGDALNCESEPTLLIWGPMDAWLVVKEDGSFDSEKLPSGLISFLENRGRIEPRIQQISISALSGWIIKFSDGYLLLIQENLSLIQAPIPYRRYYRNFYKQNFMPNLM